MIEKSHSTLEVLREVLQETLTTMEPAQKIALINFLREVCPHSPFKDFDRLMGSSGLSGPIPSGLGFLSLMPPAASYMIISSQLKKSVSHSKAIEEHSLSDAEEAYVLIQVLITLYLIYYIAPEISESIYNKFCQMLYGKSSNVDDNHHLKTLVNDEMASDFDQVEAQGWSIV